MYVCVFSSLDEKRISFTGIIFPVTLHITTPEKTHMTLVLISRILTEISYVTVG